MDACIFFDRYDVSSTRIFVSNRSCVYFARARARMCVCVLFCFFMNLYPVNTNATLRFDILLTYDSRNSERSLRSKLKERRDASCADYLVVQH